MSRWQPRLFFLFALLGLIACGPEPAFSDTPGPQQAPVDFARDVFPILQRSCLECHGPEHQKGKLRLDSREAVFKGGRNGPVIAAGKADESELLRRIALPRDSDKIMPARGEPLSAAQIRRMRDWIDQGAPWPDGVQAARHWAYVKPVRPALPAVKKTAWLRTPLDSFILARLEREGLSPSPEADRATLIRRVSLDLIGLPPAPAEVDAFLADSSPRAYEDLVDRLLASPHFGERWARPWLDLARYADSHGFQRDDLRNLWAYRDWVIRALNADMPFDQFTVLQLAGDLLPDATAEQKIATGFHRCTPINVEAGSDPEESRVNQVIDRVNTTGAVWLGSTLECAQCHDHKYDPFKQQDYYRLFAFFNSTASEAERANPRVPSSIRFLGPFLPLSDPDQERERGRLNAELGRTDQELAARRRLLNKDLDRWATELVAADKVLPSEFAALLLTPKEKHSAAQKKKLLEFRLDQDEAGARLKAQRARLQSELKKLQPATTLAMQELSEPRKSSIFMRGNFRAPGPEVQPGTPAVLHPMPSGPGNRLTLARWLVDRNNPLVARVTVNRWWAEVFGRGIVSTVEDFGTKGESPTHPELLDWLAVEFMDNGWSMKNLLRQLVLSATYRQSSRLTPELRTRDDLNLLHARGPRFRMDAEMIRDNALAVAGLLSRKQFGPPIRPYQPNGLWIKIGGDKVDYVVSPGEDRYRRGIYVVWKRGAPYPSFINFDATARLACTVKRSRSNTPLQALTLLNDPVYVEAALALAKRIVTERPHADVEQRIAHAFRLCLARSPKAAEVQTLRKLHEAQQGASRLDPAALRELFAGFPVPADVTKEEFAAWYAVATVLLNLDETITKG